MNLPKDILTSVPFQYAAKVKSGELITGRLVRLAVDRFYDWIDKREEKGYILDHENGMHVILFFKYFLKHTKGPKAGEPFVLSPYQQFTLYNIFAWKKLNNNGQRVRVIKTIYEKVARKNGKTAVLAGLGLYCQAFDDVADSEIYVGATVENQARICWQQAAKFVFNSKALRSIGFKNTQREIRFLNEDKISGDIDQGVFKFLGGDSKSLDGLSPSLSIIDEYHAHKTDGVREVLESAMGARLQPLFYIITTAGFNMASPCKAYEDVCKEILEGIKTDDSTFIMMHDLDEGDDWENKDNWFKANPNLSMSIGLSYLIDEYTKAINQPSKIPNFKTKHLNLWVDAPEVWIPDSIWCQNGYKGRKKFTEIPAKKFKKLKATGAMDLATTKDITAYLAMSYPDKKGYRYLKGWYFCPEATIDARSKTDRVPYRYWRDAGYLIATPGNTTDYDYLKTVIRNTYFEHGMELIAADQWNCSQIANDLDVDGIDVQFFPQAIGRISHPTKQFEKLVLEGKIIHDNNPVLRWMLSGCVIYRDPNDNIKVHKGKSNAGVKRVDGVVGAIMALGSQIEPEDNSNESKYNNPNIEVWI